MGTPQEQPAHYLNKNRPELVVVQIWCIIGGNDMEIQYVVLICVVVLVEGTLVVL
jgi:hypothetical protein